MTFRETLKAAFADLRKIGYAARMGFSCCNSCGHAALGVDGREKYVFFSRQSIPEVDSGEGVYLQWAGDGAEIVRSLRNRFREVAWEEGDSTSAIWVGPGPSGRPAGTAI